MKYSCKYKTNPSFPYDKECTSKKEELNKPNADVSSISGLGFLDVFLSPIENLIGRKIEFEDILLIVIIYVIFTEKNKENNTLLLCLLFILFS